MKADYSVGIVGAGFAGLVAALQLKKSGRDSFVVFERAAELGGTWRDNVYPGCACDIASPLYSFADEPNPNWSRQYGRQPEILAYLKDVALRNGLKKHIRYNSDIVEARFMEAQACWAVTDRQGNTTTVALLLMGPGPLNRPHIPNFSGLGHFQGKCFHSAQWDTGYSLKGKRVAVIGTGASAIQIVPSIAPQVAALTVLQRTPAWVTHRFDYKIGAFGRQLYRHFPFLLQIKRNAIFWLNELFGLGFVGNKNMNKLLERISLLKLQKEVKDPRIRRKLTPDYTIGCKRILRSDDYYPTFNRENVNLVIESIECFTERGIVTADGKEHQLDAVIFCTGFVAADINLYTKIIGLDGRELVQEWSDTGAEAYLGTTIAGYPNFAYFLGPNTGLGHNSVVHIMESQMNYLMQYLAQLERLGEGSYLDVLEEEQQAYNSWLQQQFKGTVWSSGCKSWYQNKRGKNTVLYPRLASSFRKETEVFNPMAYRQVRQKMQEDEKIDVKL
ncbi:NAD(P)/FAD-dependent oxidoreductase [Cesiribacter sp. SM1]|uniref:flavin-containing monooxygenase n=1 Tax=Cesiribacter sp. SM1 TaxID=2861196 RepID=UPI001CD2264B|nr:NAD(P)/FAD-dependent oxidoreductase [Cesiribacter sp. SM1]